MSKHKYDEESLKQDYELTPMSLRKISDKHGFNHHSAIPRIAARLGWKRYKRKKVQKRDKKGTKKIGGRTKSQITTAQYKEMNRLCGLFCTGEEVANEIGMDYEAMNRALMRDGYGGFVQYFKSKSSPGKLSIRAKQLEVAEKGDVRMLIHLGKNYLGQFDSKVLPPAEEGELEHVTEFD